MAKIKINKEVRRLLGELDESFVKYGEAVDKIAEQKGDDCDNFAEKKLIQDIIIGKAWLIVKAATGKKDVWETYGSNR